MTEAIARKAQRQYDKGADLNQKVVAKFFDAWGSWKWFLMNQDPADPDYCWGIVKGHEVETGSFLLSELKSLKKFGMARIERDLYFKPTTAREILSKLEAGEHV